MIKVGISGILGTMGSVLKTAVLKDSDFKLVLGFDKINSDYSVTDLNLLPEMDVLIDFSHPALLKSLLEYAKRTHTKLVLATTGYSQSDFLLMDAYKNDVSIFYSPNYSIGIYLMRKALSEVSRYIDNDYDIEIVETHHRFKKDAPSGTAIKLYEEVNQALKTKKSMITENSLDKGIHMHSLRLGSYVGEHSVYFSTLSETIEIKHTAHDKLVFAEGTLKAAKYLIHKEPGLYDMDDLLGGML